MGLKGVNKIAEVTGVSLPRLEGNANVTEVRAMAPGNDQDT